MDDAKKVIIDIMLSTATGRNRLQGVFRFLRGKYDWDIRLPQTERELDAATDEKFDGIIVSRIHSESLRERLETDRRPTVFLDVDRCERRKRREQDVTIMNDNGAVGMMAAEHFLSLGAFRSFGYVPMTRKAWWCERRYRGFKAVLKRRGLSPVRFAREDGADLDDWLVQLPKPSAVFCACDFISRETLEACRRRRIGVPEKISLLGVDNDELICQIARPELSSIPLASENEGFEAARALAALMRRTDARLPRYTFLKPLDVVARASTQPPPPAARLVQSALDLIARDAVKGIASEDVARQLGCSLRLLNLRFATYHNQSVKDAILHERLAAVCDELRLSNHHFGPIAKSCGFTSAASLANTFRRIFGMSMRAYRQTQRTPETNSPNVR